MKRFYRWLFILLLILTLAGAVLAQVSPYFDVGWHVLSGGGGSRGSAGYQIDDTLGQWSGGLSNSAHYQLTTGFWHTSGVIVKTQLIYAPVVINSQP
ncbi:exported protein of unknown function [Candidatus Promineifilum breve]|uniref:Uncharacterized protein n=1 Tax=Candidatus Promineifilum breve TaxID=1806508 RepID=A0A160T5N7_9CHLR|nr:hypothetical protein [Candidatus Promineifilum breve]CUS04040.2 exported protein of unknown function [Candidatus Promineifilum breve]